ncbi:MAG: DNA-binding CsgD family transcriptional regulator, partial [Psychromonas sp.]
LLKTNVDGSVNKASTKISKLIKRDASDDHQWEQITLEFGSLHKGFLDALIGKHGSFIKSEIRLISLMKMNLSSKDIADTLNISSDGIKKARYRLRKKLNLSSEEDIQGFLLSYQ